ncbi:MAG: ABC transporter substrate-binding protein [Actinomycetes bacterium]
MAGIVAMLFVSAGCGLKPDAVDSLKASGAGGGGLGTAAGDTGNGGAPGATAPGGSTVSGPSGVSGGSGGAANGPSGTASTGPNGTTLTGTGPTGGTQTCGVPTGGTTTGITSSTINIGLHAPLTGTGTPFPNNSFKQGANTFWQQPGHTVCGRKVQVDFQDDGYTPSGARSVCSDFAKHTFLAVGGGGTDQIQACATQPDIQRTGTPYLSAGVTTNGLTALNNYFAVSLTYEQQGNLVLRNAVTQKIANPPASTQTADHGGKKAVWAIVTGNSPNFDGATVGMQKALDQAGIPYKTYRQDQNGDYQAAATNFGKSLALDGFRTIYVVMAPGYFVFMSGGFYKAGTGIGVNWVGPGVTYTEVTVAQYLCGASTQGAISGHAWFLAPAPGIDRATPDFIRAYKGNYDDIMWSLWGLSSAIWQLLKDASNNLTRQNFIATSERAVVPSGVYPALDYAHRGGHFGGTGAWVQRVNCFKTEPDQHQPGYWDTIGSTYLRA